MCILRVISDLHLELRGYIPKDIFPDNISTETEEILILAGDIGDPYTKIYADFLELCRSKFELVIVILGNHECMNENVYFPEKKSNDSISRTVEPDNHSVVVTKPRQKIYSYEETVKHVENLCKIKGCVFLNNSGILYKGVKFIGSVLWSHVPKEKFPYVTKNGVGIFKWMYVNGSLITPEQFNVLNKECVKFLKDEINRGEKVVVITHYPMSKEMVSYKYRYSDLVCMYYNDLENMLTPNVTACISGHTHNSQTFVINNAPLCSNSVGSPSDYVEGTGFNKNFSYTVK